MLGKDVYNQTADRVGEKAARKIFEGYFKHITGEKGLREATEELRAKRKEEAKK